MCKQPLVLVVEDQTLNDAGFASETVSSGEEALKIYEGDTKNMVHSAESLQGTQSV